MLATIIPAAVVTFSITADAFPSRALQQPVYPGFNKIASMFVFGDSWSRTGFDASGEQPLASNPLGNPAYRGRTSANGTNWVGYLTTTYNQSLIRTYNFGTSGATLDSDLVASNFDVLDELNEAFIPLYATNGTWESETTLFAIWISVNDINRLYMGDYVTLDQAIFDNTALVTGLETAPVRIPRCLNMTIDWNTRLEGLKSDIEVTYSDATVFYLDTNTLFNDVIDDPTQFDQTAVYKDTTSHCVAYNRQVDSP
ncbi:hypothetical protein BJX99DRAFT_251774 [Aspergillus californicus]